MNDILVSLFIIGLTSIFASHVNAATCTAYDSEAFALWDEGQSIKHSRSLQEFGWSTAGPHGGWLKRWQALRDDEESSRTFSQKYQVYIADIYQVIDEYRTAGSLDSFYQELENEFNNVNRCD